MEKKEFTEKLKEMLAGRLGEGVLIEDTSVLKNNGISCEGITIRKTGENVSPNIYTEALFQRYQMGEELDEIFEEVLGCLQKDTLGVSFCAEDFMNFERMRERIVYKLINYEKNELLLRKVPHERFLDLAKVYYYLIPENENGITASVLIHYEHLKIWKVEENQIKDLAFENTPRLLPPAIIGMRELIGALAIDLQIPAAQADAEIPMYVMSNDRRINGAATLAYPDAIRNFALNCQKSIYVIPSSVHELILIPEVGMERDLGLMVKEVNRTALDPKDVLADHVYYYDLKDDKLMAVS